MTSLGTLYIEPARCNSFLHARILRLFCETDGFPAVATTVVADGEEPLHSVITVAPRPLLSLLTMLSGIIAETGEEGWKEANEIASRAKARFKVTPLAPAEGERDAIRAYLMDAVQAAADGIVTITESEPAFTSVTNHDPGDEDTTPVHNPEGGGWDDKCVDEHGIVVNRRDWERGQPTVVDAPQVTQYENWKPSRDVA